MQLKRISKNMDVLKVRLFLGEYAVLCANPSLGLENVQVSAEASLQADWENNRLINVRIGQTIGEVGCNCQWEKVFQPGFQSVCCIVGNGNFALHAKELRYANFG